MLVVLGRGIELDGILHDLEFCLLALGLELLMLVTASPSPFVCTK